MHNWAGGAPPVETDAVAWHLRRRLTNTGAVRADKGRQFRFVKIAFDHQIFVVQHYGGVSRVNSRIAQGLAAAGDDVRIFAPLHINAHLMDLPPGLVFGRQIPATLWRTRFARAVDAAIIAPLLARHDPDIVQETYYAAHRTAPRRARVVVIVHDMIHELFPGSFPANDPTARLKAAAVDRADHLICVSQNTRHDLIAIHPAAAAKSSVALLGVDRPVGAPPAPPISPAARPYLLHVGPRRSYKNFDGLLAAFAASPILRGDFDLLAVGGGAFDPQEIATIASLGLSAQVRQRGADDDALRRLYAGAAVFVYPSLYEGFGIPLLEAMAAGCPVVAMNISSVPEVCGPAAIYAQPGDPGSLMRAMESVALSPSLAAAQIAAGQQRVMEFSWDRTVGEFGRAYRALL